MAPPKKGRKKSGVTDNDEVAKAKASIARAKEREMEDAKRETQRQEELSAFEKQDDDAGKKRSGFDPSQYLRLKKHKRDQFALSRSSLSVVSAAGLSNNRSGRAQAVPQVLEVPNVLASMSEDTTPPSSFTNNVAQRQLFADGIALVRTPGVRLASRVQLTKPTQSVVESNLSMTSFTDATLRSIIKNCVKDHIFPKCKFFNRYTHGHYHTGSKTMCGQIMKYCRLNADASWWYTTRPMIIKTLTDHRNNCIKRMQARYKGMRKSDAILIDMQAINC